MNLQHTIKAFIRAGETHYVAECVELAVVTQGVTLDETLANLREAVALHIEGEGPLDFWPSAGSDDLGHHGIGTGGCLG